MVTIIKEPHHVALDALEDLLRQVDLAIEVGDVMEAVAAARSVTEIDFTSLQHLTCGGFNAVDRLCAESQEFSAAHTDAFFSAAAELKSAYQGRSA